MTQPMLWVQEVASSNLVAPISNDKDLGQSKTTANGGLTPLLTPTGSPSNRGGDRDPVGMTTKIQTGEGHLGGHPDYPYEMASLVTPRGFWCAIRVTGPDGHRHAIQVFETTQRGQLHAIRAWAGRVLSGEVAK